MKWVNSNVELPTNGVEILVKAEGQLEVRRAKLCSDVPVPHFRFTDTIHPLNNVYCPLEGTFWLKD